MQAICFTTVAPPAHDIDALVNEINERGYCVVDNLLSQSEVDRVRAILTHLAEEECPDPSSRPSLQRVWQIAVKHPVFLDLLCHPLVVAVWQRFLGLDMVSSSWTGITLHPGQNEFTWHIDYPYWSMSEPYPTWPLAAQTVWLLDDFTEENGGTGVIPYSHQRGAAPRYRTDEWPDEAEVITGTRGSVVLANGAWWHCARPNCSSAPRSALLGMYVRKFCIPQENMRAQLERIKNPTPLQRQLLCGDQHEPSMRGY